MIVQMSADLSPSSSAIQLDTTINLPLSDFTGNVYSSTTNYVNQGVAATFGLEFYSSVLGGPDSIENTTSIV
jgi:hypothetical protein